MSCTVITYKEPGMLEQVDAFKPFVNCLHVSATKNMREGLFERFQKNQENPYITAPIVSSNQLISHLLDNWSNANTKLQQYLTLSSVIQETVPSTSVLHASFRRNQVEVLETIRLLEVVGVQPDDLIDLSLSEKEETFIKVWSNFIQSSSNIDEFQKYLSYTLKNKINDKKISISSLIEKTYKGERIDKINLNIQLDTIVLHGFYFITPEQQRVYKILEQVGIHIVFLNLYDPRYPNTFSFIEQFINEKHGWVNKDFWNVDAPFVNKQTIADKFLADFEGRKLTVYTSANIKVVEYPDFYAFLSDFEKEKQASIDHGKIKTFIAPNASSLNNRLQEYYPEVFKKKRRFLSFPIGKFLFQLHQMWDSQIKSISITESGLYECFASGWLFDKKTKQNAREYTKVLQDIIPYFKGCSTMEQWEDRAKQLEDILENVISQFSSSTDHRFETMMSSPFSRLSTFSVQKEDVSQVIRFINNVIQTAFELFGNGEKKLSLSVHFKKLRRLVFDSNPHMENEILDEERYLVNELKKTLETAPALEMFLIEDINDAISLYLSGNLKDDFSEDYLIHPFYEIDGEMFKDNVGTHVTGLDENSLPFTDFSLPWPLQQKTFDSLAGRNIPLSFMSIKNKCMKEITRYLMYNLIQFSNNLELSWMVQYEDKNHLDKAIYLSQLDLNPNSNSLLIKDELTDYQLTKTVSKSELDSFMAYPVDALAEFKFCPRRFYYSYMTEEYCTFQNEFIYEFLYGNLLKSVKSILGSNITEEEVKFEVDKLFPFWTELKRTIIAGENFKYTPWAQKNFNGYTPYGKERSFSDLRKLFLFPALENKNADDDSKKVYKEITDLYSRPENILPSLREDFEKQLEMFPVQMEAQPSGKCRFCPHNEYCPEAHHPVDDGERKRSS